MSVSSILAQPAVQTTGHVASVLTIIGAFAGLIPTIAALLAALWYIIEILESKSGQALISKIRSSTKTTVTTIETAVTNEVKSVETAAKPVEAAIAPAIQAVEADVAKVEAAVAPAANTAEVDLTSLEQKAVEDVNALIHKPDHVTAADNAR